MRPIEEAAACLRAARELLSSEEPAEEPSETDRQTDRQTGRTLVEELLLQMGSATLVDCPRPLSI